MAQTKQQYKVVPVSKVFSDIKAMLWHEGLEHIAIKAKVSVSTLYNWINNVTKNPHIGTLIKVASVLGYDIALRRQQGTKPKQVK